MYYVKNALRFPQPTRLDLSYPSKCSAIHGHNWIITVECRSHKLNSDGMVTDFTLIKEMVTEPSGPHGAERCASFQSYRREHRQMDCGYGSPTVSGARCRKAKAIPPSTRLTSDDTASPQSLWLDTPEPKAYLKS